DIRGRNGGAVGEVLRWRVTAHLVDHVAVHARDAIERLYHVHRDPDGARMVGDRPSNGLADPPRRVGRELEPAAVLEPIHGLHQADVALLDKVEQRQVASEIALCDRDYQTEG